MKSLFVLAVACLLVSTGGSAVAQDLQPGDAAPSFELPGTDGNTHRLVDYRGRTVVLAWFPRAFTGG